MNEDSVVAGNESADMFVAIPVQTYGSLVKYNTIQYNVYLVSDRINITVQAYKISHPSRLARPYLI